MAGDPQISEANNKVKALKIIIWKRKLAHAHTDTVVDRHPYWQNIYTDIHIQHRQKYDTDRQTHRQTL